MIFTLFHLFIGNLIPVNIFERVVVFGPGHTHKELDVKIDTGAYRTSISKRVAKKLGLLEKENIVASKVYRSALGRQHREIVKLRFSLKGKVIETQASVSDRSQLLYPMIIGRRDLEKFIVRYDPQTEPEN